MNRVIGIFGAIVLVSALGTGCSDNKPDDPPAKTASTTKTGGGDHMSAGKGALVVDSPAAFSEVVKTTRLSGAATNAHIERVGWVLIDASKILEQGTVPITCRTKKIPCDGVFDQKISFKTPAGNYTLDVFMLDPDDPRAQLFRQEIPLTLYDKAPPKPVGGKNEVPEANTSSGTTSTTPSGTVPPPAKLEDATG